jgi:hypothetical protein
MRRNDRLNAGLEIKFPPQGMKKLRYFENKSYESFKIGDVTFMKKLGGLRELSMTDYYANLAEFPWQTPWKTLFDPHWSEVLKNHLIIRVKL